jgi:hypothetical protein
MAEFDALDDFGQLVVALGDRQASIAGRPVLDKQRGQSVGVEFNKGGMGEFGRPWRIQRHRGGVFMKP